MRSALQMILEGGFAEVMKLDTETSLSMARTERPFANAASSEEGEVSIFPIKILLATDGPGEAELATRTAVDLSQKTDAELHVIHVLQGAPSALLYPDATDPKGVELPNLVLEEDLEQSSEQQGRQILDGEVERVQAAGGTVAQAHLTMGEAVREIVHLAEDLGTGLIVMGSKGRGE
jgi:nucleotide-binding universal stress UspA family protein